MTQQTERDALIAGLIEILKGPAMLTTQEATAIADAAETIKAQAQRIAELEDRGADWEDAKITTLRAELKVANAEHDAAINGNIALVLRIVELEAQVDVERIGPKRAAETITALRAELDAIFQTMAEQAAGRIDLDATHIALLEIALKAAQAERDEYRKAADTQAASHKVERDALALDAERYRWLRDPCSDVNKCYYSRGDYGRGFMNTAMLDRAIDAAQGGEG